MVSDGYVHAGVGGLYRMGWGWKNLSIAAWRWAEDAMRTPATGRRRQAYLPQAVGGKLGDGATRWPCGCGRTGRPVLTGPPSGPSLDPIAVDKLMSSQGVKVICGGTSAQMAARVLGKPLRVQLRTQEPELALCPARAASYRHG